MRISVVVPCYNCAGVVGDCLASVLSQGPDELEVVCVDDGSTDDTRTALLRASEADPRVVVVAQENRGVSAARNAGLERSTGDVVLFVDADDELVDGALEHVSSCFLGNDLDCLVFGMTVEPPEAAPLTLARYLAPRDALLVDQPLRLVFHEHAHPYAVRAAFARAFLVDHGLRFDEGLTLGEDEAFLMTCYMLVHRALLSSKRLYRYRMSPTSASHRDNASDDVLPKKLDKHLALVESVLRDWRLRGLSGDGDRELLDWCLDLLMLDVSRLDAQGQAAFYERLWKVLEGYFGKDGGRGVAGRLAQPCLRAIQRAAFGARVRGDVVPKPLLVAFYVSRRGLSAVAERALAALRGEGAYR